MEPRFDLISLQSLGKKDPAALRDHQSASHVIDKSRLVASDVLAFTTLLSWSYPVVRPVSSQPGGWRD